MIYIRRYPFAFYLFLAFGLCWLFWIPRALLSHHPQVPDVTLITLQILGAFGPAVSALLLTITLNGRNSLGKLFSPYTYWNVGTGWYLLVIAFRPFIWATALGIYLLLGYKTIPHLTTDWAFFTVYLLSQLLIVGIGEELGWMGFAYPRLRARYGFLFSGLLLGIIWGLWHLPMFFTVGDSQFGSSLILFVIKLTALRLVMTMVFDITGSLLMPALFHVSMNALSELVPLSPNDPLAILLLVLVTTGMMAAYRLSAREPSTRRKVLL